jgi:hypothetical protein
MRLNHTEKTIQPNLNSLEVVDMSLSYIRESLIEPMQQMEKLDNNSIRMLNVIGRALKTMAEKAHSFEQVYENNNEGCIRN